MGACYRFERRRYMRRIRFIVGVLSVLTLLGTPLTLVGDAHAQQIEPFTGEIRWVAFNFAPVGWLPCDGRLLSISSNIALFALLGTIYGGDGRTTFGLPDFRGR